MTDAATQSFEDMLIADMRAHDGQVTQGPLAGHPLMLVTVDGARSGEPRRVVLTRSVDGQDYVVAGTAGGSPKPPAWLFNVQANPEITVEMDNQTFQATATTVLDGPERDRLWAQHVAQLPWFADYPAQTGRIIPMVVIRRAT